MQVFISYSSHDKDFASRLCNDLTLYDINVWFDDWSIRPGDSITKAIEGGLRGSQFVLLLLSRAAVESEWVQEELSSSLYSALSSGRPKVIPLLLEDCDVPVMLRHRKNLDFIVSEKYDASLNQLIEVLHSETNVTPPQALIPGFIELKLLGEGAFSTVYKAIEAKTAAIKAIKFPKSRRRLEPELAAINALGTHPGIVPIERTLVYKDRVLLVMPYAGYSLKWFIDHGRIRPRQIEQIITWMCKLLEVMAFAHSKKIIHCDIKPSNILIDEFGDLRVVDFGIAQRINYADFQHSTIVRGTLCYMSPEQQLGYKPTSQSDLYSFGGLFYELVTGEKPVGRFRNPRAYNSAISPELELIINRCLERDPDDRYETASDVLGELRASSQVTPKQPGKAIVGVSKSIKTVIEDAQRFARGASPVLIMGESGTGKELVAHLVYDSDERSKKAFVAVNLAAIPDVLVESVLFGHVKGAFTGATRNKSGLFQEADGGTLFLDEVDSLSLMSQVKLLRVLSEREFRPVGSNEALKVDVRIVAATNMSLENMVATGRFRKDLFYRLSAFRISIPPLRERREDIPSSIEHFAKQYSIISQSGKIIRFSKASVNLLTAYDWPGNVRELRHLVERILTFHDGESSNVIEASFIKSEFRVLQPPTLTQARLDAESDVVNRALAYANGNLEETARVLEVSSSSVRRLRRKHKLLRNGKRNVTSRLE